jgi:class 3 adenylate cyclase
MNIRQWLESLKLGEYADVFEQNKIESDLLDELTDNDLRDLGVHAMGDRKRILRAIAESGTEPAAPAPDTARSKLAGNAERRQLTVMFCDLVGSTELSQQLDPERLRDVITRFQDTCKRTIEAHSGYIARYMGDGVLAYFGYPMASEDDAERAVRAGKALIEQLTVPDGGPAQRARIGIATGPVVVGDLIGEGASLESAVIGETPNLAARLQGEAAPNTVFVSALTQSLTRGFFQYEELGPRSLKGFEAPQQIWRLTGDRALDSRFEALRDSNLSEFVGRRSELGLLTERWEWATQGEGQVVLGKSSTPLSVRPEPNEHRVLPVHPTAVASRRADARRRRREKTGQARSLRRHLRTQF